MVTTLATPDIAGYTFDRSPDLTDPKVREQLSASAIKAFIKIAGQWKLTEPQARGLLGGIASSTFHAWKTKPDDQKLTQDTLMRISLVIGIYKALHILYPDAALADRWVKLPNANAMFGGQPALSFMVDGGIDALHQVRRLVDARRGGVN